MGFLDDVFWGNSIEMWLKGAAVALVTAGLLRVLVPRLIRRVSRFAHSTNTYLDDALMEAAGATRGFFYVVAGLYAGGRYVQTDATSRTWANGHWSSRPCTT